MANMKDGKTYCDMCNGLMRYRRRTNDYACTMCPRVMAPEEVGPIKTSPYGQQPGVAHD